MTTIPFTPNTSNLFSVRQSKNVGPELVSLCGNVVAWIADPILGHLICRLLNEFLVNDDFLDAMLAKEDFS
jgi:hypothetical protein